MPIYEYICRDCGQPFEKMVRLSETQTSPTCPSCGSPDTRKQLSTFASRGASSAGGSSYSSNSSSCSSSGGFS